MDRAQLIAAMDNEVIDAEEVAGFNDALIKAGCTTINRAAMFCAQIGHESVGLRYYSEIWGPTSDQNSYQGRMGNNNPGDGYRYRGRGPIQITGKDNYRTLSAWAHAEGYVPTPTYFVDNPDLLAGPKYGFLGAVWYWTVARPQINSLCDAGDLNAVTRAINGGYNGIDDRRARWNRCRALGAAILPTGGSLMALTDKEQAELLAGVRWIKEQLGPKLPAWGDDSSMGKNAKGEELTVRDGLAAAKRDIDAIKKAGA